MPSRRTPRPAWAAALALFCGCSSETTTEPVEPEQEEVADVEDPGVRAEKKLWAVHGTHELLAASEEVILKQFDAAGLSREEIWALGVSRFGWYPEEPPAGMTRESLAHRYYVDLEYGSYYDSPTFYYDGLGYDE